MTPPKYNFYICKSIFANIAVDIDIDDSGNFIYGAGKTKYATTDKVALGDKGLLFFNFVSLNSYNCVFFYDTSGSLISKEQLTDASNMVIIPPSGAAYWGARFTKSDSNFVSKIGTDFVYTAIEVNPHYKSLSKKYAKESSQEFFRVSLDGKINLYGDAYNVVKQAGLEDHLMLFIYKYDAAIGTRTEYYRGEFSKTDCKFDFTKRKLELKVTTVDDYNNVLDNYDNTYDLLKIAPALSKIDIYKRSMIQLYVHGASTITNIFGGTYWEEDVAEAIEDPVVLVSTYHFVTTNGYNEFTIEGSEISEVNGVYAGGEGKWYNQKGYMAYSEIYDSLKEKGYVYIKRISDGKLLYKSSLMDIATRKTYIYRGQDGTVFTAISDNGVVSGTCTMNYLFVYLLNQRLICDVDSITDSTGTHETYDLPKDNFVSESITYKKCIGVVSGSVTCTSEKSDEPTRYGMDDYGQYFINTDTPSTVFRTIPVSRNLWANASLWYTYSSDYELLEKKTRKQYTLKDSYSISAAIKALLKKIDPNIQHEETEEYSKFLYGAVNPLLPEQFRIHLTQKTNVLKGDYDQAAQKAEITLEDLMKMLRDCFKCYWFIEDGKFKIEHIYYFLNGRSYTPKVDYQFDFTQLKDQFNKMSATYAQSEIEFDKSDLNSRYEFAWMDDVTDIFGSMSIDVKSNYIQKDKTEEININNFTSDIDYMLLNPSNFSNDGFALLCPIDKYKTMNELSYTQTSFPTAIVSETLEISGKVTIIPVDEAYVIKVSAKRADGTYIPVPVTVTEPITLKNAAQLQIMLQLASGDALSPADITSGVATIGKVVFDGKMELPVVKAEMKDENGNTYNVIAQNWYASWAYLQKLYMWDMPASNIESSATNDLQVYDVKKCMTHTIEVPVKEDPDVLGLIKTRYGNGRIEEMSIDLDTRQAKIDLAYSPE